MSVAACTMIVDTDKSELGPKPAFCDLNQKVTCACPSGEAGTQTCNPDRTFVGAPCCVPCAQGLCDCLGANSIRSCP